MTSHNYQQLNLKNKNKNELSKQLEQNKFTEIEITWRVINRGVGGGERAEGYRE